MKLLCLLSTVIDKQVDTKYINSIITMLLFIILILIISILFINED